MGNPAGHVTYPEALFNAMAYWPERKFGAGIFGVRSVKDGNMTWTIGKSGRHRPEKARFIAGPELLSHEGNLAPDARVRLYKIGD
jgi:hypothetical protein